MTTDEKENPHWRGNCVIRIIVGPNIDRESLLFIIPEGMMGGALYIEYISIVPMKVSYIMVTRQYIDRIYC